MRVVLAIQRIAIFSLCGLAVLHDPVLASLPAWSDSGVVITDAPGLQVDPVVTPDVQGGAFIAWRDQRPGLPNPQAQAYLARIQMDGTVSAGWQPGGQLVSMGQLEVSRLSTFPDGSGGAVLFWEDPGPSPDSSIGRAFMHRFRPDGSPHPQFPVGGVRLGPLDTRTGIVAISSGDAGFFIATTWRGPEGSGSQGGILLARVDSIGTTASGWPLQGVLLCDQPGVQSQISLMPDPVGGVFVLWRDLRFGFGSEPHLFGSRISASGVLDPAWPAQGRDLATFRSGLDGYRAVADPVGFIVSLDPGTLLAFDVDGLARAGWPPPAITQDAFPVGPRDQDHRFVTAAEGTYIVWTRLRQVLPTINEAQRMLLLVEPSGQAFPPWPDTGRVVNRSFGSDTAGVLVLRSSPAGLYIIYGAKDVQGGYWKGGVLQPDLNWAPGWPDGGRLVSRFLGGGSNSIATDGALYHAFVFSDGLGTDGIRLFKMGVDGPVPTLASVAMAEVRGDAAHLEWLVVDPPASPIHVERSSDGVAWEDVGNAESVAGDRVRFSEGGFAPGERRAYRLAWTELDELRSAGLVWVQRDGVSAFALRWARIMHAPERIILGVLGAERAPIQLRLFDVQGRQRAQATAAASGDAEREITLPSGSLAPGVYLVRASQGATHAMARVVVTR